MSIHNNITSPQSNLRTARRSSADKITSPFFVTFAQGRLSNGQFYFVRPYVIEYGDGYYRLPLQGARRVDVGLGSRHSLGSSNMATAKPAAIWEEGRVS